MADKFSQEYYGTPPPPHARPKTMPEQEREKYYNLPPLPADPRHTTLVEQFRIQQWKNRNPNSE
jgi:hypothetical protein